MRFVDAQHVVSVDYDRELQQRREKQQIRVSEHGPAENAIRANRLQVGTRDRREDSSEISSRDRLRERAKCQGSWRGRRACNPEESRPTISCRPRNCSARKPAAIMAVMLPRNVPNSMMPLPHESRFSGSSSGSNPYFDGPKSAPSVLIKNTPAHSIGRFCSARPAM